ncbi:hypothetical protein [Streptomyces sp. NPDC057579]|uniref:hypothetical protein n=1 Tax=Streptomyces sp. NPDC057579 TaxID=3346172 RepID=UPI00367FFD2F
MAVQPELEMTLYNSLLTAATAGTYTFKASHVLKDREGGSDIDTDPHRLPVVEESFVIKAVEFALDPSAVHAHYPAANASGNYRRVLPHVTLNRAILPWEHDIKGKEVPSRAPWVALLLFREDELPDDSAAGGLTVTRPVTELLEPEPGVLGPDLPPPKGAESMMCRTIDVPPRHFTEILPSEEEMHYLAHLREVRPPHQLRDDGEVLTEGEYGVLTTNRFPRTPGSYVVHLASLEGHQAHLPPNDLPVGTLAVRLCSLFSWTFTCSPTGSLDAAGLLQNLVAPGNDDPEDLALRLAPPQQPVQADDTQQYALRRLRRGYVPVSYRPMTGELTFAWYRGPCTPVTAPEVPLAPEGSPHPTADHALIYEPEHGVFDVSYASAWTLGRSIALADPEYVTDITRARRELANRAATLKALARDPYRAALDPDALPAHHAFTELVANGFAATFLHALEAPQLPARTRRTPRLDPQQPSLSEPRYQALLQVTADRNTHAMPAFLDRLALLHGVPFNYLVPDPRMLPAESMRLFRIDPAWIQALLAGAGDTGIHTTHDLLLDPLLRTSVARARAPRAPAAGLLISSALVPAWPEFEIVATRGKDRPVEELRRAHLGADVLLILFDAVPDQVSLREPGQGIHFGIGHGDRISLRDLDPGPGLGAPLREQFPAPADPDTIFTRYTRPATGRDPDVLQLLGTRGLLPALAQALDRRELTPSQFALELVNARFEQLLLADDTPRSVAAP